MSMAPATQAESAAVCADWRENHMLVRSTAKPRAPSRNVDAMRKKAMEDCPDSLAANRCGRRLNVPPLMLAPSIENAALGGSRKSMGKTGKASVRDVGIRNS